MTRETMTRAERARRSRREARGLPADAVLVRGGSAIAHWPDDVSEYVEAHPDGMTHEQIAAVVGVSRQRIHQIEVEALRLFVAAMERAGLSEEDVIAHLTSRHTHDPRAGAEADGESHLIGIGRREVLQDERIAAQAPAWQTLRADRAILALEEAAETARAHRFIERVVCGMEGA